MSRILSVAVAFAILSPLQAEESIAPETLDAVKKASVYIRVEAGARVGSGSGFVLSTDGDKALLATNHHVVTLQTPNLRPSSLTVVFDSGTKNERTAKAEILAMDREVDLAILRVTGVKDLPSAISYASPPKLVETMNVYTFGFPFGETLSVKRKSFPAITVGKAAISSLRTGDDGELSVVQLDGNLNPGNSGGPVVDAKGRLVGIAVAKVKDSTGIGLAIPSNELTRIMDGRIGNTYRHTISKQPNGKIRVRFESELIDPLGKIRAGTLHFCLAEKGSKAVEQKSLAAEKGSDKATARIEKSSAVAEFEVEKAEGDVRVQLVLDNGKTLTSPIRSFSLAPREVAAVPKQPGVPRIVPFRGGEEARMLGFGIGPIFRDIGPPKSVLIGLELGLNKDGANEIIRSVRPIYSLAGKESFGEKRGQETGRTVTVKAKAGFAIGAVTVMSDLAIRGMSVSFMKAADGKLDQKDSYESEWIGTAINRPTAKIVGDGTTAIGIVGRTNDPGVDLLAIGLLYKGQYEAGTRIMGGAFDPVFKEKGPQDTLLVGFEVGLGKFFDNDVVRAIRPVFRKGSKDELGEQRGTELDRVVKTIARPGYAVGAVTIKAGLTVDGMSVTYMKIVDGKLDPKDSYESEWIGGMGGGPPMKLAGDGTTMVGIVGKANAQTKALTGLGLLPKGHD